MNTQTKIDALREAVVALLAEIDEISAELRGQQTHIYASEALKPDSNVVTRSGKIRGLQNKVLTLLKRSAEPMSSDDISRALFQPEYGVSFDAFKRRVIVTSSYLHKKKGRLHLILGGDGTPLWNLVGQDYKDSWAGMVSYKEDNAPSMKETRIAQSRGFDSEEKEEREQIDAPVSNK